MHIKWNKNIDFFYIIAFIVPLIVLDRFLYLPKLKLEGMPINIYILFILLISIIGIILKVMNFNIQTYRIFVIFLIIVLYYLVHMLIGNSQTQSLYALLIFILPCLYLFHKQISIKTFDYTVSIILFISFLYSIIYILSCIDTSAFLNLIGQNVSNIETQTRGVTPLGGAISVGTFLNFTLPFNVYFYNKRKNYFYFLYFLANILATLFTLSRTVILIAVLIIIFMYAKKIMSYIYLIGKKKINFLKLLIVIIGGSYFITTYDFSRITIAINPNKDESSYERFNAVDLGVEIFKDNLMFGTGIGTVYHRIYENRYIEYKEQKGLIDPHNGYILCLSEGGVIGTSLFGLIILLLFQKLLNNQDRDIKNIGICMIIAFLVGIFGGSFIFNDPKLSSIIWLYFSLLVNLYKKKVPTC